MDGFGGWEKPFGESSKQGLPVGFDRSAEFEFRGAHVNGKPGFPAPAKLKEASSYGS